MTAGARPGGRAGRATARVGRGAGIRSGGRPGTTTVRVGRGAGKTVRPGGDDDRADGGVGR
ncbi:hypothetical protein CXF48_09285 [Corynebacterium bovis]|uniref:Uncharacterized protein n=1 Tax=Corynebacterium bovis TaxID=36808 RepID=A0A3R8QLR8_9CORY|nr:hypothetical protein CXF48_09285 [Corynebacterium bovis]RRO88053.1 hypothetical protein CXF30_06870 [Corynebacterium bovis]